ncbi:MAG: aspartate--tRNA ligase [Deltaproteobacteria bacterium]|nr:aspartate--tRNA ligase [Deltaproteobacteria bacterium]MBW2414410.1 aspartate--tRNA ligase [Deltaproteobacteria bacterium]
MDLLGNLRRTHYCGELRAEHVGQRVVVCGWVHRRRDHGGVVFVDLRDRTGLGQVVFKPDASPEAHARADVIRSEYVLVVCGVLERRADDAINPNLPTGEVELIADELRIVNFATPPPFPLEDDAPVEESTRMRYRAHDLRRAVMQRRLELRHRLHQSLRAACVEDGFLEIETPILTRATPEGARDFLVPSRLHPGSFFALPQSPQIIKQLLMVAGYDRYFQIARCFRDEDLRADRQLEFSQLDLEMSFVGVEDVLEVLEEITARAFREVLDVELARPFPRLSYDESMARYGTDRPDTRIELEIVDLTDAVADCEFKVFSGAVKSGGLVRALPVPKADEVSRGELDRLVALAQEWGAKGLAWIRVADDGSWQSPIAKFLSDDEREAIASRANLEPGHLIFFMADRESVVCDVLARLRSELGHRLGRVADRPWEPLFVLDFPVFTQDDDGKITYMHMPFVAPREEDIGRIRSHPLEIRSTHYDLVMNGIELGSGSLRNHRSDLQLEIFEVLGYAEASARERFGFLLDALDSGAPPHGGFAFGLDRLALLMAGGESLRDVIAFPKTQRAQDLFMQAPGQVDPDQLRDLGLRLRRKPDPAQDPGDS